MIEKALDYMKRTALEYGTAKGEAAATEKFLSVVKAEQMNKSEASSLGQRETDAYASKEYKQAILAMQAAIEKEAHLKWMLNAAVAQIEIFKVSEYSKRVEMRNL